MKRSILAIGGVLALFLLFSLAIDMCELRTVFFYYEERVCMASNLNPQFWGTSIVSITASLIAVFGTWYVTDTANKGSMKHAENISQVELLEQKKTQYRLMNKENRDIVLENMKIFRKRNFYLLNLLKISNLFEMEIFDQEIINIFSEDEFFLNKLKEDFFYDEELLLYINKYLSVINKYKQSTTLELVEYWDISHDIYSMFFSYDKNSIESFDYEEEVEAALKEFWKRLTFCFIPEDSNVKEVVAMKIELIKNEKRWWLSTGVDNKYKLLFTHIENLIKESPSVANDIEELGYLLKNLEKNSDYEEDIKKLILELFDEIDIQDWFVRKVLLDIREFQTIKGKFGERDYVDVFVNELKYIFEEHKSDNYYENHILKNNYI